MSHIVFINREPAWPELDLADLAFHVSDATGGRIELTAIKEGTDGGLPSVAMLLVSDDGSQKVLAETTLSLFLVVADTLRAKYGDPRQ